MLPNKDITYDIAYSQICHMDLEIILDMLKNIKFFNKNNNILICLHLSDILYESKHLIENEYTIVNEIHYDKHPGNKTLFTPILENFNYLCEKGYKFNNYMTLTSSAWFIKQIQHFDKQNFNPQLSKSEFILNRNEYINKRHWRTLYLNDELINKFNEDGIKVQRDYVSGRLYSYQLFKKIYDYIVSNGILDMLVHQTYFEEFILISLIRAFTDDVSSAPVLVKHFEKKSGTARIPKIYELKKHILDIHSLPIVKRIPVDDINNDVYKFIQNNR